LGVGVGVAFGLAFGVVLGLAVGLVVGDGVVMRGLLTCVDGSVTLLAPWLVRNSANGTTIKPTTTVSTKVTAPHSRRRKAPFTGAEF